MTSIGLRNGLVPVLLQTIYWTNILSFRAFGTTYYMEFESEFQICLSEKTI